MDYVYHRVPDSLHGTVLRPLNDWRELEPELYAAKAAKYVGREYVMEEWIEPLNCLWNDVLFFQPVHPAKIDAALVNLGHALKGRQYYRVPVMLLTPKDTVLWLWEGGGPLHKAPNSFVSCTPEEIAKHQELRSVTLNYYAEQFRTGKSPLLYFRIPHVLYKGTLDTTILEIITV